MARGIHSTALFSTLKYTGAIIADRFYTTLANQELILFKSKDNKQINCNSITIEADGVNDIYFSIVRDFESPETFDYTDEPVIHVKAGETLVVNGVQTRGIKLSNDLGAILYVTGTKY